MKRSDTEDKLLIGTVANQTAPLMAGDSKFMEGGMKRTEYNAHKAKEAQLSWRK